ncbi:unnamed protein product [Mesocestoides corti]|uniref:Peptidase_M13_N domain-containing protein n=1 Tax=Mesocestoides corti TaxID=53468 RepID=A0A0R3UNI4_MESCO|nr:unnamed protein product [Mesocestoides corti]
MRKKVPLSPPVCTGGVFEYAASYVEGLNWRRISTSCSLSETDQISLLCVLFIGLAILCILVLSDFSVLKLYLLHWKCHSSRNRAPSLCQPANETLLPTEKTNSKESLSHMSIGVMVNFNGKLSYLPYVTQMSTLTSSEAHRGANSTASLTVQRSLISLESCIGKNGVGFGDEEDRTGIPPVPPQPLERSKRIRAPLVLITLLTTVALMAGTAYTCFLAQRIETTACGLTKHAKKVVISAKLLTNSLINEAYTIIIRVIGEDVSPSNANSYLRPFVEEMKHIFGNQAMRLYAMANDHTPSNDWLCQQTASNLQYFGTFLHRLSSLFAVAPVLSSDNIKAARDISYSYIHELARLAPHPLFTTVSNKTLMWRTIQILNYTAEELCRQHTSYFPTCADVESHFEMLVSKVDPWPKFEKGRDITSVTSYMQVPRLLNSKAYVKKWLPLAQDPTGNIPFLFDEFLLREIRRAKKTINENLEKLPRKLAKKMANKHLQVARKVPAVLTGILTLFLAIFLVVVYDNCRCSYRLQHQREVMACARIKRCPLFCLRVVTFFAALLCATGVALGVLGGFGQDQICNILFVRSHQGDPWLHYLLDRILRRSPALTEILRIENLQLQLPKNVLSTLDTNYTPNTPPFLLSIGMNRPANLTALLYSAWLNRTLYGLWYRDVWRTMERANISCRIPRVPLSNVFDQFRRAVMLDQTFDDLYVGNTTDYLPEPINDYYTRIGLALKVISKRGFTDAEKYATYFTAIGNLIAHYQLKFDQVAQALNVIKENKRIIEPLLPLIKVGDVIVSYLSNKSNSDLVSQFTNNTAEIWLNSRLPIDHYVLPIVYKLLDRLFPYPTLRQTYRQALSPICPTDTENPPLFLALRNFGFALSLSSLALLVVCVVRIFIQR